MVLNSWKMTMFVTSKKEAEEAAYLNQTRRMDKSTSLSQLQSYLMNWWGASPTAYCCQPSKIPQIIWPYCPSAISSIYMYTRRYCKDSQKCWKKCLNMRVLQMIHFVKPQGKILMKWRDTSKVSNHLTLLPIRHITVRNDKFIPNKSFRKGIFEKAQFLLFWHLFIRLNSMFGYQVYMFSFGYLFKLSICFDCLVWLFFLIDFIDWSCCIDRVNL